MKKIKIIDLLNKIANGEEVPKEIKVNDNIYHYDETDCNEFYRYRTMTNELLTDYADLNDEVEIIEEEKKIPEKWNDLSFTTMRNQDDIEHLKGYIATIMRTQNEIIDYLESKEKGEQV